MVVAWGYTWLLLASVFILLSWTRAASLAAEGAFVAFALTIASGALAVTVALGRTLVERRLQAAGTAFEPPGT